MTSSKQFFVFLTHQNPTTDLLDTIETAIKAPSNAIQYYFFAEPDSAVLDFLKNVLPKQDSTESKAPPDTPKDVRLKYVHSEHRSNRILQNIFKESADYMGYQSPEEDSAWEEEEDDEGVSPEEAKKSLEDHNKD